jgi:hypothetical protein
MAKRLISCFLFLGIIISMTGCDSMNAVVVNTVPPTADPSAADPSTAEPPTSLPPTEMPATPTSIPPTTTPAFTGGVPTGCVNALTITDAQIDQTLCVWGIVGSIWNIDTDYHIMFRGAKFDTFFLASFNWPTTGADGVEPGECVYLEHAAITKNVERYLNAVFSPGDVRRCKTATPSSSVPSQKTSAPPTANSASRNELPAGCMDALSVSADHVNQIFCIGGIVDKAFSKSGDYYIYFKSASPSTLFFISNGWPTSGATGAHKGDCVFLENAVVTKLGAQGIMSLFTPRELKRCE